MAGLFDNMRRELQTDAPGAHPEPDVLNAYMEGALSTEERESVVGHLSHCSDCRDVVALAAPPLSQTAPPASLKDPAIRLALWRWAVVAVTAVVVIGAILVNTNRRENLPEAMTATITASTATTQRSTRATSSRESKRPLPSRRSATSTSSTNRRISSASAT
jgi:anti-sigma-K factor RskA